MLGIKKLGKKSWREGNLYKIGRTIEKKILD